MLRTEHLRLAVPGRILCQDLSLELAPGQCWAILGRNGSGKTTLLHALSGLARPAGGEIRLDGQPLAKVPRRQLAQRVGVLLQEESHAFSGSALDYVLLGRFPHETGMAPGKHDVHLARQALEKTEMAHASQQSYATLSGGERQRVRIAQLLAQAPEIYFLDEPLQHLDLPHQVGVMRLLAQLAGEFGKTVVMVLHDMFWASRHCDHALLIYDDGKTSAGQGAAQITLKNMENLYQCRLRAIETSDGNYFLPTLE